MHVIKCHRRHCRGGGGRFGGSCFFQTRCRVNIKILCFAIGIVAILIDDDSFNSPVAKVFIRIMSPSQTFQGRTSLTTSRRTIWAALIDAFDEFDLLT